MFKIFEDWLKTFVGTKTSYVLFSIIVWSFIVALVVGFLFLMYTLFLTPAKIEHRRTGYLTQNRNALLGGAQYFQDSLGFCYVYFHTDIVKSVVKMDCDEKVLIRVKRDNGSPYDN